MVPTPSQVFASRTQLLRFSVVTASLATVILISMIAFNLWLDPSGMFTPEGRLRAQADSLLAGRNLLNLGNYDERAFQEIWISKRSQHPSLVILGSSRVMGLSPAQLGEPSGANHAVSGAMLEDLLALVADLARHGQLPRRLLIGLDPWMLNVRNSHQYDYGIFEDYAAMLDSLGFPKPNPWGAKVRGWRDRGRAVVSPVLFQTGLRQMLVSVWQGVPRPGCWFTSDKPDPRFDRYEPDGTYTFPPSLLNRMDTAAISAAAIAWVVGGHSLMEGFDSVDVGYLKRWWRLLDWLKERGVQVTLYLPPFHPAAWGAMQKRPEGRLLIKVEELVRREALSKSVVVVGSWDNQQVGLYPGDFLDATHIRREAFPRVLRMR